MHLLMTSHLMETMVSALWAQASTLVVVTLDASSPFPSVPRFPSFFLLFENYHDTAFHFLEPLRTAGTWLPV